jgi:poly(A) polymerase Pap1
MEYCGVPIDLTCARLKINNMPEEMHLSDPKILGLACDSTDILSLNGT